MIAFLKKLKDCSQIKITLVFQLHKEMNIAKKAGLYKTLLKF